MATIQHLQSSTQIIDLAGVKILTDPWLTSGEYLNDRGFINLFLMKTR